VVDDASRLAYVEVLPDEKRQSVTGLMVARRPPARPADTAKKPD
jgi:hypothetical protein